MSLIPKSALPFPHVPKKRMPAKAPIQAIEPKAADKKTQTTDEVLKEQSGKDRQPLPEIGAPTFWHFERATPLSEQEAQEIGALNNDNDQA